MFFITSRMPTKNTEPALNEHFIFDLGNNASSREEFRKSSILGIAGN